MPRPMISAVCNGIEVWCDIVMLWVLVTDTDLRSTKTIIKYLREGLVHHFLT